MAESANLPLEIKRGATFYREFTMLQGDGITPLNITGWVGKCDVKKDISSSTILFSPVISVVNGSNGIWSMSVSDSVSKAIPSTAKTLQEVDMYWYDVRFNTGSEVEFPLEGIINIKGASTTI